MSVAGQLRRGVYILQFLFNVQYGLTLYFNSSFLSDRGFSTQAVSGWFALAYGMSLVVLLSMPAFLRYLGSYRTFIAASMATGLLLLGVALATSDIGAAMFLVCAMAVSVALTVPLDVFLETTTADESKTGFRRGLVLTLSNGALIVAQFASMAFLAYGAFPILYAASGFLIIGIGLAGRTLMRTFREPPVEETDVRALIAALRMYPDILRIFILQFLLRLFYGMMIVFTPLYLHNELGMPLSDLALVFAAMLIPFLILEVPLGRLEDSRLGEREILVMGSLVIAFSTAFLSTIPSTSPIVWALALLVTRIGAAMLDVGSEGYFFKHVQGRDAGLVSAFRTLYPLGHIAGPVFGAGVLLFLPLQFTFVALGLVMLIGIPVAGMLRDTR